jgi:threonylcarbamoyladenosine tRNA methylthiotransferase MtaB
MKVYLDTIGCRLNQSEIELLAAQFRAAGHEMVEQSAEADWVVVNTCAVTAKAASDSRQKIRQAVRTGAREVIVTGCWATLEPSSAVQIAGVTRVVDNDHKEQLVHDFLDLPKEEFDHEPLARKPLPGIHLRTRAFIKAQDGCDNHCTFCITRIARGPGRSRSAREVLADIQAALEGGTQEIVLSGVHLGSWGQDLATPHHLGDLVRTILKETDARRLRLSSVEPWDMDEDFFRLWENPRLCRHLHLPLQSGSASVLKRMVRKTTPQAYTEIVNLARAVCPQIAITTDLIVGFPGETEFEFEESLEYVRQTGFSNGHVFGYSSRPGTAAARMKDLIPGNIQKKRGAAFRAVFAESAAKYREPFTGKVLPVLWESTDEISSRGWRLHGLTDNYLRVSTYFPERIWNQITPVRLIFSTKEGFEGEIESNQ